MNRRYPLSGFAMSVSQLNEHSLWSAVLDKSDLAVASGAVTRTDGEIHLCRDRGLPFYFKVISALCHKPHEANLDKAVYQKLDPFLSADSDILVGYVGDHHQLLLSKFSVMEHHLVIAAKQFQPQGEPLSHEDFEILWCLLRAEPGLAIYNGGLHAGCSQLHKHTQYIPTRSFASCLIDELLAREAIKDGQCSVLAGLPFEHLIAAFPPDTQVDAVYGTYEEMLGRLALFPDGQHDISHSTLLTDRWLLIVPRSQSSFDDVHINAFALAGYFFPKDVETMQLLMAAGCMNVLKAVAEPRKEQ
ncbi:hypothetical protein [Parendozoicomonas haliclonae]|uniref:ATP adenylyltransferase n=1 Tax=Parendozoicomonas haliclonae TaxID=1960125 RepID=A0A1X7APN1_9GAMM|nr:hypothetical protein [Parendozoicomonas haliclonae]SMA50103.1 ATP adenylyltransferase [Parendozoicomonas haliclonae]